MQSPGGNEPQTSGQSSPAEVGRAGALQRGLVYGALFVLVVASFLAYAPRSVDFAGYAAVGKAFLDGRDIYLDTPVGTNTWPPFFSLAAVPLGMLDSLS